MNLSRYDFAKKGFILSYQYPSFSSKTPLTKTSKEPPYCMPSVNMWMTSKPLKGLDRVVQDNRFGTINYRMGYFLGVSDTGAARALAEWNSDGREVMVSPFAFATVRFSGEVHYDERKNGTAIIIPDEVFIVRRNYTIITKLKFNPFLEK